MLKFAYPPCNMFNCGVMCVVCVTEYYIVVHFQSIGLSFSHFLSFKGWGAFTDNTLSLLLVAGFAGLVGAGIYIHLLIRTSFTTATLSWLFMIILAGPLFVVCVFLWIAKLLFGTPPPRQ